MHAASRWIWKSKVVHVPCGRGAAKLKCWISKKSEQTARKKAEAGRRGSSEGSISVMWSLNQCSVLQIRLQTSQESGHQESMLGLLGLTQSSLLCWSRVGPRQVSLVTSIQVTVLLLVDIHTLASCAGMLVSLWKRDLRIVVSYFWFDYKVCVLGKSVLHTADKNKPRLCIIYVYIKFNLTNSIKQMVNISRKCFLK